MLSADNDSSQVLMSSNSDTRFEDPDACDVLSEGVAHGGTVDPGRDVFMIKCKCK